MIILGNQKSGTTAIAALLARAVNESVTLDIGSIDNTTWTRLHNGEIDWNTMVKRYALVEFSPKIIKEPLLTFVYESHLKTAYPDSRFIFIIRNPFQNIRSQLNWINHSGRAAVLDIDNPNLTPLRARVFTGDDFLHQETHLIKILALRWKYCAEVYLHNKKNMSLVRFEDFVVDKKRYIENLALDQGKEITSDITDIVDVQFQPLGNRNADLVDFFGDKNYKIIMDICGELMKEFDYSA